MSRATLHPDCVFEREQLVPLLRALRARVTVDPAAFRRHSAELRRATLRDPYEALTTAAVVAVVAIRRLGPGFAVQDDVNQALELGGMSDQQVPTIRVAPALQVPFSIISGFDIDPAYFLGDEPQRWLEAAVVNQVLAAGCVLLAADREKLPAAEVMDELQAAVTAITPTTG